MKNEMMFTLLENLTTRYLSITKDKIVMTMEKPGDTNLTK